MSKYNIFPLGALAALGILEGMTVAQSLLEQEEEAAKEEAKEIQKAFENITEDLGKIRENIKIKEGK